MKIYVETPVKVEKGDFLVVDDVQEKGCHCGTRKTPGEPRKRETRRTEMLVLVDILSR